MFDVPIALVIFNRPEVTRTLINSVRSIRPRQLFVIADGARAHRDGEVEKVQQARDAINGVDWPCEIKRIYSEQNMGCGRRIRTGISRAFESVEQLIILEDDCRPNLSFFDFCDSLLQRYRNERRVMAVSGNCFHQRVPQSASYYFSRFAHCWGWATWRRAWNLYDGISHLQWQKLRRSQRFKEIFDSEREMAYWSQLFDRVAQGRLDSWAVPWVLACWLNQGLTALPTKNLVSNVGFTEDATHTNFDSPLASRPTFELGEIQHPQEILRNVAADRESDRLLFSGTWKRPGIVKKSINTLRRHYRPSRSLDPAANLAAGRKAA